MRFLCCEGRSLTTIEGPGPILLAVTLFGRHRRPTLEQINEAMSGNLLDSAKLGDPPAARRTDKTAWKLRAIRAAELVVRGARALSSNGYKIDRQEI